MNSSRTSHCSLLHAAFSLTELLISIAVIAVLAAILFPITKATTERGKATTCISYLRQLATASLAYANDYAGEIPPVDRTNASTATSWYKPLGQYLTHGGYGKRTGPYFCPANPTPVTPSGNAGWTNYAVNANLYLVNTSESVEGKTNPDHMSARRGARLAQLTTPKIIYIDSLNAPSTPRTTWYATNGSRYSNPWGSTYPVHGDRVNAVFTDGHAETFQITPRPANPTIGSDLVELKGNYFWPL